MSIQLFRTEKKGAQGAFAGREVGTMEKEATQRKRELHGQSHGRGKRERKETRQNIKPKCRCSRGASKLLERRGRSVRAISLASAEGKSTRVGAAGNHKDWEGRKRERFNTLGP